MKTLKEMKLKDYFNIPNMLGYLRILLLPLFLYLYTRADTGTDLAIAFIILLVSIMTDFFDGKIARHFNMVTEFGKLLDPIADKLTQAILALALLNRYPLMLWFIILFIIRELYMAVMGIYLIKKGKGINGARMYGKVCTTVIFTGVFVLLIFPSLSYVICNIIILTMMLFCIITLLRYLVFHQNLLKDKNIDSVSLKAETGCKNKKRSVSMRILIPFVLFILISYMLIGGLLPYKNNPEVNMSYKSSFDVSSFYGDEACCDRAALIEDNGDALIWRLRMIEAAQDSIILSTFNIKSDTSGCQILSALQAAAERGVNVQILADGFNSWFDMEGNPYFYALSSMENVDIRLYNRVNPLIPWKGMSRLHDKYLIIDDSMYLLGGRNTFDYFLGDHNGYKNYDRDVLIYNTGSDKSSIYTLLDYFESVWNQPECKTWHNAAWLQHTPSVKRAASTLKNTYASLNEDHNEWLAPIDLYTATVPTKRIRLLSNPTGLYAKEPLVLWSLGQLMENASSQVRIHSPYIMCDELFTQILTDACSRNVPVTLMTNSAKNNGNTFGAVDYVMHKEEILNTGLQVLEYNGGISYHGKSLTIDDDLSIIGSFNLDMKSAYQDTELMLVVHSEELNSQLQAAFDTYEKDSDKAQSDTDELSDLFGSSAPLSTRLLRRLVYLVDPVFRFIM